MRGKGSVPFHGQLREPDKLDKLDDLDNLDCRKQDKLDS